MVGSACVLGGSYAGAFALLVSGEPGWIGLGCHHAKLSYPWPRLEGSIDVDDRDIARVQAGLLDVDR